MCALRCCSSLHGHKTRDHVAARRCVAPPAAKTAPIAQRAALCAAAGPRHTLLQLCTAASSAAARACATMATASSGDAPSSTAAAPPKAHTSAICIVPPLACWDPIQHVRCFNDKSFVRWPPHVNILYPFEQDEPTGAVFQAAAARAADALRHVQPFDLRLQSFGRFDHRSSCTLWLRPSQGEGLLTVQAALEAAFPHCSDLSSDPSRSIEGFEPHLSVGQWKSAAAADAAARRLAAALPPGGIGFAVDRVWLISRAGFKDPFAFRWEVPLGGSAPPRCVDRPYIASIRNRSSGSSNSGSSQGSGPPSAAPAAAAVGGSAAAGQGAAAQDVTAAAQAAVAADGTVWTFAFGANMAPSKLVARGLVPLESKPAVLHHHRLLFDHRGGFGNVVPIEGEGAAAAGGGGGGGGEGGGGGAVQTPDSVHGVLHRLSAADYGTLCGMEHEYWPLEVQVSAAGCCAACCDLLLRTDCAVHALQPQHPTPP